jgi:hypothetical protein
MPMYKLLPDRSRGRKLWRQTKKQLLFPENEPVGMGSGRPFCNSKFRHLG